MRINPKVRATLDALGVPWRIEPGKRHFKLYVCGVFCTILPHGPGYDNGASRHTRNVIAQIRRAARGQPSTRGGYAHQPPG